MLLCRGRGAASLLYHALATAFNLFPFILCTSYVLEIPSAGYRAISLNILMWQEDLLVMLNQNDFR